MEAEPVTEFTAEFTLPLRERYLEDYVPGARYEFDATVTVRENEIIQFGQTYDPQPFHVDPEQAAVSPFKGIIASGWHTTSLMMVLYSSQYLSPVASLGSPGIDDLRWLVPVRPEDVLRLRATVLSARRSASKPDRGVMRTRAELINQHDEVALRLIVINLMAVRPTAEG